LPSASRLVVLYNPENVSKPPEAARTVELKAWEKRSLWQRTKEFFVHMFSYWI